MTLSALIRLPLWNGILADRRAGSMGYSAHSGMEVGRDRAYNEQAFHYFLANEQKRARASERPLVLLLVEDSRQRVDTSDAAAPAKLLSVLSRCLRDTDIVGWYEEQRVAGAVLTHVAHNPASDALNEVRRRVELALAEFSPRVRTRTFVPNPLISETPVFAGAGHTLRRSVRDDSPAALRFAGQRG